MPSSDDPEQLPRYIILELTRRCNNRCLYCYNVWGKPAGGDDARDTAELSTVDVKRAITRLQEELPLETIGLTGGEPLLRPDLEEILAFIAGRGLVPVVITNGTLLTKKKVARTIKKAAVYQITLLSYKRETHDLLAGRKGAWDEAIQGMLNVRDAGGNITVVFVATKVNAADLYRTAELSILLGAKVLMYNRMNLSSHNIGNAGRLLPTASMIRENLDTMEEIGNKYGMKCIVSVVIEPCVIPEKEYNHVKMGYCPVAGKDSYLTIDPDGNIRICNHSPNILGNILTDSIREIFSSHPFVRQFRETLPEECIPCRPELREICKGGCRAAAEQCYGTIHRVDPFIGYVQP